MKPKRVGGSASATKPRNPQKPRNATPARKSASGSVVSADFAARPSSSEPGIVASFIVPGMPHPLLIPDANPGYRRLRDAYDDVRKRIEELKPDVILLYSTQWPSVIGHQVQTDPAPQWVHVDQEWHELGSIPYKFRMDVAFGEAYVAAGAKRGLEMRAVSYKGFPVDTGSIVALKLLNPKNKFAASIVSCNMYADRAETIVLGKAARDAVLAQGKRAVAIGVTALSNRVFSGVMPFKQDRIHSRKDDEWNRKYLEFLGRGRLEDASQLAREFASQANGDSKLKAVWWLAACSGAHNRYDGHVYAYEAVYGTGAALVGLTPTARTALDKEFDEDDAESYGGDRNVLGGANKFETADGAAPPPGTRNARNPRKALVSASSANSASPSAGEDPETWDGAHSSADPDAGAGYPGAPSSSTPMRAQPASIVNVKAAPKPLAAYAHARRVGDLLFVAGIGPRDPKTDEIPGGATRDAKGKAQKYDIRRQTTQCIDNIAVILKESGCGLEDVFDVSAFLIDMENDFAPFNEVYNKVFASIQPARTTVEVEGLPGPIAVELKVIAKVPDGR